MEDSVEVSKQGTQKNIKNKGFQLQIIKSPKLRLINQNDEKGESILPLNLPKNILKAQENQEQQIQYYYDDDGDSQRQVNQKHEEIKDKKISFLNKQNLKYNSELINYSSPKNDNVLESDLATSDLFFKENCEFPQAIKTDKDEFGGIQNQSSHNIKQNIQSPQLNFYSPKNIKQNESALRKNRNHQLAAVQRMEQKITSSQIQQSEQKYPEINSSLLKKLKLKRQFNRQATTDKTNSPQFTFMGQLKQINIIKRFNNKMKSSITKSDVDSLTTFQLQLLNDQSHIVKNLTNGFSQFNIKKKIKKLLSYLTTKSSFSPDSSFFIVWKAILVITYLITIFDVPLQFLNQYQEMGSVGSSLAFYYLPICVLVCEIGLNFNTGFYREGQIVEDKQEIIENYLKLQFWLDSITVCGFALSQYFPYAKVLFLIRIYNFFIQLRQFEDRAQFIQQFPSVWTLLKLFSLIFFVAHYCGCGFTIIAYLERINDSSSITWLVKYGIQDDTWQVQYIYCLYFSFITMITVGYGDVVPQTNIERVYVILMTLISAAVFGYSINTIGAIFQDIASKSISYRILKRDIGYYMRARDIDSQLQAKVYQYISYYHLEAAQEYQQTEEILGKLSQDLRLQIQKNYFGKALSSSYFLSSNFSPQFITELTFKAKEAFYRQGDYVFTKNDLDQRLLIITKGICQLTFHHPILKDITLVKIDKGDIGSKGFITGQPREVSLKTMSHCTFAYITISDFLLTIKQYPADYEKFCMLKDTMSLYENENDQKLHCFSCKKYGHGIMNCPFIHLKKSKEIAIQKYLFSPCQSREIKQRGRFKWKNIQDIDIIKHDLKSFRINAIQSTLKEEDQHLIELIDKKDKEFFLNIECFAYDQNTKKFIIDPKQPYLYPDDDDEEEEDLEELEEESEESLSSLSDYKGSIILEDSKLTQRQDHHRYMNKSSIKAQKNASLKNIQIYDENQKTPKISNQNELNLFQNKKISDRKSSKDLQKNEHIMIEKNERNQQKQLSFKKQLTQKPLRDYKSNQQLFIKSKTILGNQAANFQLNYEISQNNQSSNNNRNGNSPSNKKNSLSQQQDIYKMNQVSYNNNQNNFNQTSNYYNKYRGAFESSPINIKQELSNISNQQIQMHYQQLQKQQQQQQPLSKQRNSIFILNPNTAIIQADTNLQSFSMLDSLQNNRLSINNLNQNQLIDPLIYQFAFNNNLKVTEQMYYTEFDTAREYLIYFPNSNYTIVIKQIKTKHRIKQIQNLKISKLQTFTRLKQSQTQTNIGIN
ncbi:cation channel family protein (macronuclear) [Tetrahymena thermophila SB210]|uniref:Cation channel family protein n=1 Tax=Tetrahymena thermophila (strain SB210) TaxID=312017 RepID=I7MAY4_TETTS|nr:cation channel family protein [Tetrahymena thermophila SB210]EAS06722.2 cation channel family protein [Tetrahymena thermophila SB210]|eukprot:XP_001026964.2 cation channel family protein [Tetrahymena thermophila SB210]